MWHIKSTDVGTSFYTFICFLPNTHCNAPGNRALWQVGVQHRDLSVQNMMYKRIGGKIRGYLIDFDLANLATDDSCNLDRTGILPFMALELLQSVVPGGTPVFHTYAHDGEAVLWVVFWLCVQYQDGTRTSYTFQDWEMVDADTCYTKKLKVLRKAREYPFTDSNKLLQEPIRKLLAKFRVRHEIQVQQDFKNCLEEQIYEELMGIKVPVLDIDIDIGGWFDTCDKEIRPI